MKAKVFISCGQKNKREREACKKISSILRDKYNLNTYLAFKIQGLNDVMKIIDELKTSDYLIFIDFLRKGKIPFSLFAHQELAVATALGFKEIIAIKEKGQKLVGFLPYIQANPEDFSDVEDLINRINELVSERGWGSADYSRNLVVSNLMRTHFLQYTDHTDIYNGYVWEAEIKNMRYDIAAIHTVCILDKILVLPSNEEIKHSDRSYLKWSGHSSGYEKTILPLDYGIVNVLSMWVGKRGIYLNSDRDTTPRKPIVSDMGDYILKFKLCSQGFPPKNFSICINFNDEVIDSSTYELKSKVSLSEQGY